MFRVEVFLNNLIEQVDEASLLLEKKVLLNKKDFTKSIYYKK